MNEWPTRVRTGRAALLGDHLGDGLGADQVVEDGAAGVLLEQGGGHHGGGGRPGQGLGLVVDEEHPVGVAVEGEADVGPHLEHPGLQVLEVLGLDGVGRVVGEGAVELGVHQLHVEGEALEHLGGDQSAHAVAGVGHHLERAAAPTGRRRTGRGRRTRPAGRGELTEPGGASPGSGLAGPPRPWPGCRGRPVSWPTGRAPGRHSLIPLYWAGLWEAVSMAAGGVEAAGGEVDEVGGDEARGRRRRPPRPSPPRRRRPRARRPEARMSRPMRMRGAPVKRAKAAPTPRAMDASSSSGTTPRMSYALKIRDRSNLTGPVFARPPVVGHSSWGRMRP